jgi:hypothetical protein
MDVIETFLASDAGVAVAVPVIIAAGVAVRSLLERVVRLFAPRAFNRREEG